MSDKCIASLACEFTDALSFDTLITWADILKVEHDEKSWLDDAWPDREISLRTQVATAMLAVGMMKESVPCTQS